MWHEVTTSSRPHLFDPELNYGRYVFFFFFFFFFFCSNKSLAKIINFFAEKGDENSAKAMADVVFEGFSKERMCGSFFPEHRMVYKINESIVTISLQKNWTSNR